MTLKAALMAAGESAQQVAAEQGILQSGLTALGSTQLNALAIPTDFAVFTTVAASTGGILPPECDFPVAGAGIIQPTDEVTVVNHGANTLSVYPQVGGKISTLATNGAFSVPSGKTAFFLYLGAGLWAASVSN